MPRAEDDHTLAFDAITRQYTGKLMLFREDLYWARRGHDTESGRGCRLLREYAEGHGMCGVGIKIGNIPADILKIAQRRFRPYNGDHLGLGQGSSSGVPHDLSHLTTSSCGTKRPALISASASAMARFSSSSSTLSKMLFVAGIQAFLNGDIAWIKPFGQIRVSVAVLEMALLTLARHFIEPPRYGSRFCVIRARLQLCPLLMGLHAQYRPRYSWIRGIIKLD